MKYSDDVRPDEVDPNAISVFSMLADPPPAGSDVMIRLVPGTPTANAKVYPFKPTDILMG